MRLEDIKSPALRASIRAKLESVRKPTVLISHSSAALVPPKDKNASGSPLEALFLDLWTECGGQTLEREICLVPGRMFRCDFYHEESRIVIEIEGLKDHASIKGWNRDAEKYLTLTLLGFTVIRLSRALITEETIKKVIAYVKKHSMRQGKLSQLRPE